ncbi:hypothetical protein EKK58_08600 [Candidatus Dependentiae bacterium]|nr:MAG: hypothetical protein EKK58_08600 [Candidatus Dependentiae bacterium]
MSKKPFQFKVNLPEGYSRDERQAIAAEIVSFVRQRTLKGVDFEGSKFPKYSDSYTKSVNFRAAGKDKSSINLTLSGDMLAYLDLQEDNEDELIIGYEEGSKEAGKAEGNQIGSYGKPTGNAKKARKFLGITQEDLSKILSKYPLNDDARREARADAVLEAKERVDDYVNEIKQQGVEDEDPTRLARLLKLKVGK